MAAYAPRSELDPVASADLVAHKAVTTAAHGGVVSAVDARLSDARTPTAHGHPQSDVTNLGTSLAAKADLVGGVVPTAQIPAVATGQTVTVVSQAAMLALTAAQVQPGDVAIRSDQAGRRWVLAAADPSVLGSWIALEVPDAVSSVQGQQGAVILAKADVGLGSVDNTADAAKPVSTAQQAALDAKAAVSAGSGHVYVDGEGLVADGVTDNKTALVAAEAKAAGKTLSFGVGVYGVGGTGVQLKTSSVRWRGHGMWRTTLKALPGAVTGLLNSSGAEKLEFEDLCFDGSDLYPSQMLNIAGSFNRRVVFRRCRFTGLGANVGVRIDRLCHVTFDDCLWDAPGTGDGIAISVNQGATGITMRNCRLLWLSDGLRLLAGVTDNEKMMEKVVIEGCYVEGGWWLLRNQFAGEGAAVAYSAPSGDQVRITDTGAAFAGITTPPALETNVRVMPVLRTGTVAALDNTEVLDAGASFVTVGVQRGHIVRSGAKFAVVSGVESETKLRVEEWWDETTRVPVAPPAANAAYTVYGVWIGRVAAFTATTVTLDLLHDFRGNKIAAGSVAAGTRYEVMWNRPNYGLVLAGQGVRDVQVRGNTVRRPWSDGIGTNSARNVQITGNLVEDGQDQGITVREGARHSIVAHNRIRHCGAGGIWAAGVDSLIDGNVITDTNWQISNVPGASRGDIMCINQGEGVGNLALRNEIVNNICTRVDSLMTLVTYGIAIRANCDGNRLRGNHCRGHLTAGIRLDSGSLNTKLRDNEATISDAGSIGSDYGILSGAGTPEGVVAAPVGTMFRRSNGGAGTTFYIKESGTGSAGWVAK